VECVVGGVNGGSGHSRGGDIGGIELPVCCRTQAVPGVMGDHEHSGDSVLMLMTIHPVWQHDER